MKNSSDTNTSLKITFTGDFSLTGFFNKPGVTCGDVFDSNTVSFLQDSDFSVINLEGPTTDRPIVKRNGIPLVNPLNSTMILTSMGNAIANLANNHIMDCGSNGLTDTIERLEKSSIMYFGAGRNIQEASAPIFLTKNSVSVGLLAVCHEEGMVSDDDRPGIFCDKDILKFKNRIDSAKNKVNWLILNYHGGEEFTFLPMPLRRQKLHKFLDLGFDIIVCHHPHVVQPFEYFGSKLIIYSLGNFLFDLRQHRAIPGTDESVLVTIEFTENNFTMTNQNLIIDRLSEKVLSVDTNDRFSLLDRNTYRRQWRAEAYRVFVELRKQAHLQHAAEFLNNNHYSIMGKIHQWTLKILRLMFRILINPIDRIMFFDASLYLFWDRTCGVVKRSLSSFKRTKQKTGEGTNET